MLFLDIFLYNAADQDSWNQWATSCKIQNNILNYIKYQSYFQINFLII
jgi:hypothetical protein